MRESLDRGTPTLDGLVVLDQVSLPDYGVVTTSMREHISAMARQARRLPILADSRERIGLFRDVCLKPNQRECQQAVSHGRSASRRWRWA